MAQAPANEHRSGRSSGQGGIRALLYAGDRASCCDRESASFRYFVHEVHCSEAALRSTHCRGRGPTARWRVDLP